MAEIKYKLRERDLIAFSEYELKDSKDLQRRIRRHQSVIPGMIAAVSLFYWFYYEDVLSAFYIGIIGVAWGLLSPIYFKRDLRGQIKDMFTDEEKEKVLGSYVLRALKRELVEITPEGQSNIPWSEILRVEVTKKYAFIYLDAHIALIIPKATVEKGNIREFAQVVDQRIEEMF